MNSKTKIYIGSIMVVGGSLIAYSAAQVAGGVSTAYLLFVLMALLGSTLKVRLPGMTGTISTNFVFVLVATAVFTFAETVLLAAAAVAVQSLWRSRSRAKLVQLGFNSTALAISAGAAYRLSFFCTGSPAHTGIFVCVAASVYFISNTLLVSGVLSLVQNKPLLSVWQQCHLWSFPYYLAGAVIAGLVAQTNQSVGWPVSILVLAPMAFTYVFFRFFVQRSVGESLSAAR